MSSARRRTKSGRRPPPSSSPCPNCQSRFFSRGATVSQRVTNHPSQTRLAHSFGRAARGRWSSSDRAAAARSHGKRGRLAAFLRFFRRSRLRGPPAHRPAARCSASAADIVMNMAVGVGGARCARRAASSPSQQRRDARKGGPRRGARRRLNGAFMYRFFRTFVFHVMWPPERVLVCQMDVVDRCCEHVSDIL